MTRTLLITPYGFQNQGIRLLATVLREQGHEATALFFKRWLNNNVRPPTNSDWDALNQAIAELRPELIGIGFGSPYLKIVTEMTERLRKVTKAPIIWGGVHPTISPEDGIEHADAVCLGEGEGPILDVAEAIANGRDFTGIANLWVARDGKIEKNPLRPLIENLDDLPYHRLFETPTAIVDDGRFQMAEPLEGTAMVRIFASRGCPFGCAFCYNSQYREIYEGLGKYHRGRTVESVLDEIEAARRHFKRIRRVRFDDDSFVFPKAWTDRFCELYPSRIGVPFDILLQPQTAREETLAGLKKAGLVHVQVGIQSASDSMLEGEYGRPGSASRIEEIAEMLGRVGIEVTYDVILDDPLATVEDAQATLDLLMRIRRPFNLFLYSLTVFPKSETARKLLAAGKITEDQIEGRATKSFEQFRFSFGYPRPAEDAFYAGLISLTSKGFIPKALIRAMSKNRTLREKPGLMRPLVEVANFIKLAQIGTRMLFRGELSWFKLKEYLPPRGRLVQ
jgi:radical SAM superfamily enzyme YgiQ (UPF0313 family)